MKAQLVARNPAVDAQTKSKSVALYVEYRNADKFKRIATGFRILAKHWDNATKRIKANGTADVERAVSPNQNAAEPVPPTGAADNFERFDVEQPLTAGVKPTPWS